LKKFETGPFPSLLRISSSMATEYNGVNTNS
jgi:hypothetical protein